MTCRSGPQELLAGTGPGSANKQLEVSKGCAGIDGVYVFVVKLFHEPTLYPVASSGFISRLLNHNTE